MSVADNSACVHRLAMLFIIRHIYLPSCQHSSLAKPLVCTVENDLISSACGYALYGGRTLAWSTFGVSSPSPSVPLLEPNLPDYVRSMGALLPIIMRSKISLLWYVIHDSKQHDVGRKRLQ